MNSGKSGGFLGVQNLQHVGRILVYLALLIVFVYSVVHFTNNTGAAGSQINPDAAGNTTQGTRTTCGTAANFDCVNDGLSSTSIPSTTGDFVTFSRNQFDSYQLSTIANVATATAVQVFIYHAENSNYQFQISLWNAAESTQYGTTQAVTTRTASQWDSVTISGLNLTQTLLDGLRVRTTCVRTGTGNSTCTSYALYAYVTYDPVQNVTVATTSAMQNVNAGSSTVHVGGAFAIKENTSSRNITSITIAEGGTIDASTNLKNVKLMYDLDTAAPFDCATNTYNGNELQFGSTDADGFSSANGTSTFTDSVAISTTQALCVYPVMDVGYGASAGQTINIRINDASTDVVGSGSAVVGPTTTVALFGTSTVQKQDMRQMRYHWRNDDGTESGATSATGGTENTQLNSILSTTPKRLRLEVSNEGNITSTSTAFMLEYAQKISTCAAASGWTDVGQLSGDWDMYDSTNLTDGNNTTDIIPSAGGVTNENTTFKTGNAAVKDTSSVVATTTLASTEFIEMEFSVVPTISAANGNTYCFRVTHIGNSLNAYDVYPEATILADITITATGTQTTTGDIPKTNFYAGGGFVATAATAGTRNITSFTLYASGTVDYQNDIDNIKLFYELDTVAPYDCTGESYGGSELQYGVTDTDGFSGAATTTFTDSVSASTTQGVCFYVVYDVLSTASNNETLDLYISNPSQNVQISSGTLAPTTPLAISGVTTFTKADLQQLHYHWRTDTGTETTATSATNGAQDTALTKVTQGLVQRLRILVSNEGASTSAAVQYRLEFAPKTSSCSAATGWENVATTMGAWDMVSSQLVEGSDTTNISVATGGVTDENSTFLTPNGGQRETTAQTGSITLTSSQFVELEYSIRATASSSEGVTYCFRVTNAGTELDTYVRYPEASIKDPTDFLVQRDIETMTGTSLTITAGVDYIAPASSTRSFIRITNPHYTGAGDTAATANQTADSVTVYITNPSNLLTSVTFARGAGATSDTRFAWEIVEYIGDPGGDNEIVVREQSTITYGVTALGATTTAISGIVNDNDVVVFITGQFNPDTGRNDYNTVLSTSKWNASSDTATFDRGEHGNDAVIVSYAVVEFTGQNWAIQRSPEHVYTNAGSTETETISSVNSLARTFIHAQKRAGSNLASHADFGHEVWLSGLNQISFRLATAASTPGGHTSVAWVIENTQTAGDRMVVTRSSYTQSGGTPPVTENKDINATLDDFTVSSIFINSSGAGTGASWPEPMFTARLLSTTQYEIWVSNTGDSRSYQTEVVEWPTAARKITQNYYRFYVNNNLITPTDPWPVGATDLGENTEVTGLDGPVASGGTVRIRMTLQISSAAMLPNVDTFKLQYGLRSTTCSAIPSTEWYNLGDIGSTTALWRATSTPVTDGTALSTDPPVGGDLKITSVADVAGTFEEENYTAFTPYRVEPGEDIEYDWAIQNNNAADRSTYCFRMTESDGTVFLAYNNYPTMRTAGYGAQSQNWRWYDDAESATPTTTLAATNTAPINISFDNPIVLRIVLKEVNGASSNNTKFKLQFSESSSFATSTDVAEIGTCTNLSYWCYADGSGVDNATITARTLSQADSCSAGTGDGCGTYNESGTTTSTFFHRVNAAAEFSFTLRSSGARVNRVYYFRIYDVARGEVVPLGSGYSYPSLTTEGASLSFSMTGLATSTTVAGVTLDRTTTPTQVSFGSVPLNTFVEAGHRLSVSTDGTEGYLLLMKMNGDMQSTYGTPINSISNTNAAPASWAAGCSGGATSCFGYHTTDSTLQNGSARFAANDTYARISTTTAEEIAYSSQPKLGDTVDVVFRILVRNLQEAGLYESNIMYISVPIF